MLYIFYYGLWPNTAAGNRYLTFLKGFDELGVDATAVLLTSYTGYRIQEQYRHVKVEYLWHDWRFARRIMNPLHRPIAMRRFLTRLKPGDVVFCYGVSKYVSRLVGKKEIRVFHENTESPEVLTLPNARLQADYLESCLKMDGLFVISTALKEYYINKGVDKNKIHIINMTVDYNRFNGLKKNMSVEKYIAYCGTASNNKDGVDELIKAFSIVAKKHIDVKLYIIGQTPSVDDKAGNLKLIDDLGIKEKVVFTGMVNADKMPQLLKDASVLALDRPNNLQAQNGFPTKLGEYLLSENPVVVTKVGDIPLFLKDGESALLAEPGNVVEFASKICWALEKPAEAAVVGSRGKEVALKEFNYLTETRKIINAIYN